MLVGCLEKQHYDVLRKVPSKESNAKTQFSLMDDALIDFENNVKETAELNFLNFSNIYNGAGVVTADFNNDGLVDILLLANQGENKLYLNEGEFKFKDITHTAGIADRVGWTTGASAIDINNDGWMDIYICKSGELQNSQFRHNRLYINQKDNTFKESAAEWKIDDNGFSTQSYFFDFDKDGDLDMFLVNHRVDFHNTSRLNMNVEKSFSRFTSDKLYRNDVKYFTEITHKAGLVNKAWGLSAAIGDFNHDNWPDIYVCNDFLTPDMLYINNKNGTFTNEVLDRMNHISFSSMGSDYADINNDELPDLLVLEMASEDHIRSKENMPSMNTRSFYNLVEKKYHYQYMVNTLQLNTYKGQFSEIAQLSGVAKTDWSWAPLIADFDNDGYKDVFITNGILKEMGNQDFRTALTEKFLDKEKPAFDEVSKMLPSTKISNYSFKNNGDYTFTNTSEEWGFKIPSQSNGVAYADFDNDGDLDLVVNNINDNAQVFKNNDTHNFIQLRLTGEEQNPLALGSKVTVTVKGKKQYQELYLSRGFLSSVHNVVHFGVGNATVIDEILIEWPNELITRFENVKANQILSIDQAKTIRSSKPKATAKDTWFKKVSAKQKGIRYTHKENAFDDFKNQVLLPHSQSTNGPFIAKADVNGDGRVDFFVGGAAGQPGELYFQGDEGHFERSETTILEKDKDYEDLGVLFFDADKDGDQDLYVVSGGAEYGAEGKMYQDRLYINDGKGNFTKSKVALPDISSSGQVVKAADVDNDGDLDLFVGGRVIPDKYPFSPKSYILINEKGIFTDQTAQLAPAISQVGMVTDAVFTDYDLDGDQDLIVVGEWMPLTLFENVDGHLHPVSNESFEGTEGMWFSIEKHDIDGDGDEDYFVGNLGLNTKYKASEQKPFHVFCDDFDQSGTYDIVLTSHYKGSLVPSRGRECSSQQMPFIKEKFPTFSAFAHASVNDIYGEDKLNKALHLKVKMLTSVFVENKGDGTFIINTLPNLAQVAPIMDFEFIDTEQGKKILLIGNHHNTEVETTRYDASYGTVLKYEHNRLEVVSPESTGFFFKGNAKDMAVVASHDGYYVLVTNNNDSFSMFAVNNKD